MSRWAASLALLLAGALALRVVGVEHGLPYAYNADENANFVPRAIGLFGHGLDPGYFVNPPAYTYLVHAVLAVWFGGRAGVAQAFAADPTDAWIVGRLVAAGLGTAAVGLLAATGARLFDRRTGWLAGALLAAAFLPVLYSHLALNDVPLLLPLVLSLYGCAGVLRGGGTADWLVAGTGLGLACATKYTAGIVLLALLAAAVVRRGPARDGAGRGPVLAGPGRRGLALAVAAALAAFVAANPSTVLDPGAVLDGLAHQTEASGAPAGKLGLRADNGWLHYLWSLTWGLGWVPLVAAGAGAVLLARRDRPAFWLLVPAPVVFLAYMGAQERYFARWLMPMLPFLCLLATPAAVALADRVAARAPRWRKVALGLAGVALCAQGLVLSGHSIRVLGRADTRALTRAWMVQRIRPVAKVVIEPVVPAAWAQDVGRPLRRTDNGDRWIKYPTSRTRIDPASGRPLPPPGIVINPEDFERVLRPELVDRYVRGGFCWVVVGSTQRGRAEAQPERAPGAIAYYRELERRARVAFRASPYDPGEGPVAFDFDTSFTWWPLAYERPGPEMTVFRLRGGRCGPG